MVSSQNNTGFVQRKKNAGDKKKTSSYFHAVCRFATTMSAWISMLKLLTMINFVCVSGAAITMETGVSTQGAGTSEERHAHTPPVLEMRRDTHHPMKTGDQQDSYKLIYGTAHNTDDSYKLIYGHDGITHNKLTDDGVETSDHGSGDSVGFDNHAGGDRVESSDNTDGNNDEFDNYAGGESVESAGHVASDGVESAEEPEGPVVRVHGGMVRGLTLDKAHVFYGIPYAAPPVGQRRWAPPHPVLPWLQTYNATFPRPACMQACAGEFSQICPPKVSEDCLYLNVFVPRTVNLSLPTETQRPVLVWIHGGDFIAGSASRPLYDGRFMSNYSNTVVVNVEYRLGAFGFLVTGKDPELSAVGNYGMLDQQAALVWIKNNIPVFAGDPKRVTLVGESAGAQSVALHLMMRSSEFLFSQAAIQSLPFSIPLKTRWDAKRLGRDFARTANCSVSDLLCLKSLSARDVLRAQVKSGSKIVNPFRFLEVFETWGPYIDEVLIEDQPIAAFQKGYWQRDKPVIIGTTSEEGVIFVFGVFSKPVSVLESMAYATAIFKQHTLTVLHKYLPLYLYTDRRTMLSQIVTDFVFLCPTRHSARSGVSLGGSMWMYVFDYTLSDPRAWAGLSFCYGHACHGAELPFLFDSGPVANLTFQPPEALLANRMLCYWGAFAHCGDPNSRTHQSSFCRDQRLPVWPRYTLDNGWPILNLTVPTHAQHGVRDHICDFWDNLDIY
ncbi:crystal protein isoform X1 [Alosa sapidissima]|uniref:crystal protein isoform X1 n=2 Tax=Alosa sapidissima TaxID=34773 RepID=UPI001C096AC8|nr:crystal protein isoform X1 [Alosa sapidissima]